MAGHRFGRTDRDTLRAGPEYGLNRARFGDIAQPGRSRVGVNIIDVIDRKPGVLERELHGPRCAFPIRWRRGHVIGIPAQTVANQFAVNFRVSLFRALEFLNHHNAGAFANDKTVSISVPRRSEERRVGKWGW